MSIKKSYGTSSLWGISMLQSFGRIMQNMKLTTLLSNTQLFDENTSYMLSFPFVQTFLFGH
jgi:hypothetical protein